MPQVQLPVFPDGSQSINSQIGFQRQGDQVVYLNGHLPVFTHQSDDLPSFRLFTTQLIVNGTASQGDIARAFGLSLTTIKRCVKRYRQRGAAAFFKPAAKRNGHRLTPERLSQAQDLLNQGQGVPEISRQLGVLATTLHKAIDDGRLSGSKKKTRSPAPKP